MSYGGFNRSETAGRPMQPGQMAMPRAQSAVSQSDMATLQQSIEDIAANGVPDPGDITLIFENQLI